ncbi:MAG: hypothetical protein M3014_06170 [Chloroflexota bacterium]|nr:hypothetical protein [Chloroflexota bacterium]
MDAEAETREQSEGDRSVVCVLGGHAEAERAVAMLRSVGVLDEDISVASHILPDEPLSAEGLGSNVAGAAGTGATFGGVLGGVSGWMLGVGALAIPGVGTAAGAGALATTTTGAAIGLAVGGLIGALAGIGIPEHDERHLANEAGREAVVVTVLASSLDEAEITSSLRASGAYDIQTIQIPSTSNLQRRTPDHELDVEKSLPDATGAGYAAYNSQIEEEADMSNNADSLNPNNVTGTQDAIDPITGALGTAGTPMTTGYGVSGSTIGLGSESASTTQEDGDYRGATPDTKGYESGGRQSSDAGAMRKPDEKASSVNNGLDAMPGSDEAPVQSEPTTKDIYEKGPSYGENNLAPRGSGVAAPASDTGRTDLYADAAVDAPPTYSETATDASHASAGTNIPGTADIRGLGDNTDEPSADD